MKTTSRWLCAMIGVGALVCATLGCSNGSSSSDDSDSPTTGTCTMTWFYNGGSPKTAEVTSETVITISSDVELGYLASLVNSGGSSSGLVFKLTDNIFLNSNTADYQKWVTSAPANVWKPIGSQVCAFNGTFDGNGKTVYGMYTVLPTADYQGLFGNAGPKSVIKNLTVAQSVVTGAFFVGSVAGKSDGTISDCTSDSIVSSVKGGAGGVVGVSSGTISSCKNSGTVTTTGQGDTVWATGGVFGRLDDFGVVTDCSNTGSISGWMAVGGVGGSIDKTGGVANRCVNSGSVSAGSYHAGGIMGMVWGKLLNSSSTGDVTCVLDAGGAVGSVGDWGSKYQQAGPVENCFSSGSVTVSGSDEAGAFVGRLYGTVENCYATGKILQKEGTLPNAFCGDLLSDPATNGQMTNCYWLSSIASAPSSNSQSDRFCTIASSGSFSSTGGTVVASTASLTYTGNLLSVLNAWVAAHGNDGCASWVSDVSTNGGYPIFASK